MIDQRGQRRQVGGDGQRQGQAQAPGERGLSGEQRGIRLLTDDGGGRAAARIAPNAGRPDPVALDGAEGDAAAVTDTGARLESGVRPAADPERVERPRRLRCDEMHAAGTAAPPTMGGRAPGPLRARIAQRHARNA
jgi:hypothetical protein